MEDKTEKVEKIEKAKKQKVSVKILAKTKTGFFGKDKLDNGYLIVETNGSVKVGDIVQI